MGSGGGLVSLWRVAITLINVDLSFIAHQEIHFDVILLKKHKYFQSGKFISNCHLYAGNFYKPQCVTLWRKKSLQSDCTLCGKAHLLPVSLHSISVMRKRISCDSILMTPKWLVQVMKLSFSAVDIFRAGAYGIRALFQYKDRLS